MKVNLLDYYKKKVRITDIDGRTHTGWANWYFYPDENESGKESISLDNGAPYLVEFEEDEITKIEIIEG